MNSTEKSTENIFPTELFGAVKSEKSFWSQQKRNSKVLSFSTLKRILQNWQTSEKSVLKHKLTKSQYFVANSRGFASILVWSNRQSLHRWHKCTRKGINLPQLTADSLKEPPKGLATKTYNQKSSWLRLHFSLAYQPHTKFNFLSPAYQVCDGEKHEFKTEELLR